MSKPPAHQKPAGERLHKFLARAGLGSRRACEAFISQGRVQCNGQTTPGTGLMVDEDHDEIRFDGELVRPQPAAYYLVYKPRGVVCTTDDQFQRTSVVDLVHDHLHRRLFPVGRLEEDSEGLILVTNDGGLAHRIADYRRPIRHTYFVKVRGSVTQEALEKMRAGVWLSDGRTSAMTVKVQRWGKKVTTLLITPAAYQHRQLRRVVARVGLHVEQVTRVRLGFLGTQGLKKGHSRKLKPAEVTRLLDLKDQDLGEPVRRPVARHRPADHTRRRLPAPEVGKPRSKRGGVAVRRRKAQATARSRRPTGPDRRIVGP